MYLLYLQHPHHPQNFCNAVCNSQEHPQEIQNSTAQRITESVRLEGVTVVHLVQPPCSRKVIPKHMAQDCVRTLPCAQKCWVWSTSDSWKSLCLESEFRVDSGLLCVMSTSKAPKVQLHCLWIMVNIYQSIFIFIMYCNTNWFFINPLKTCLRWVSFALLEKTRNYSTGKNLIHSSNSNQNSTVLFHIIFGMLSIITESLQRKNSKVSSENFNSRVFANCLLLLNNNLISLHFNMLILL